MSEGIHQELAEARERHEEARRGNKSVALAAAIIAVLASLGTLLAHHYSIAAISSLNRAILFQTRASDKFSTFEAQRVRANLLKAIVDADLPRSEAAKKLLADAAGKTEASANAVLLAAQDLEERSEQADVSSDKLLHAYETLEISTGFFQIAIVLASISALANTRILLTIGYSISAIGLALLIFGLVQGR